MKFIDREYGEETLDSIKRTELYTFTDETFKENPITPRYENTEIIVRDVTVVDELFSMTLKIHLLI